MEQRGRPFSPFMGRMDGLIFITYNNNKKGGDYQLNSELQTEYTYE